MWCSKSLVFTKILRGISLNAYEFQLPLLHTQALHSFAFIGRKLEFDRGWSETWETKLLASVSHSVFPSVTKSIISLDIEWDSIHAEKWTQMSLWRWAWSSPEQASLHHFPGGKCAISALVVWAESPSTPFFLANLCFLSMYFWKNPSEDKTKILTCAQ